MSDELDRSTAVCIIGAGPAGLATARALRARDLDYDQFERHHDVGGLWDIDAPGSPMYEAAHFISSRTLSGFGGFPMGGDLPDYPSHRQILAYLKDFADTYDLRDRIAFNTSIDGVTKLDDGTWRVARQDGQAARYRAVVCCSGTQWTPNLPQTPGSFGGQVLHSSEYRDLDQFRGKRVLVVGGGNSACDIVVDAGRGADRAVISMRRGYWFIPKHVFGVPPDVFAESGPKPDHKIFQTHPVLNSNLCLSLQHGDVAAKPGISRTSGHTVTFTDGSAEDFDVIIYATGYLHTVPYARRHFPSDQLPDLYLATFSLEHAGLFGVGYLETNSGAYQHFDASAQMIASHLDDQDRQPGRAREFAAMIVADRPDLSGGITFDKSPRHHGDVDAHALTQYRDSVFARMNWDRKERTPMISAADRRTSAGARGVNR